MADIDSNVVKFPTVKNNFGLKFEQTDLGKFVKAIYSVNERIFIVNKDLSMEEKMRLFKIFYNDIREKCTDC